MKIKRELPQYEGESVLFVATGTRDGIIYLAGDGEVRKLKSFRVAKPKYSDKEGFTKNRRTGVSGSARELDREDMQRDFLKEAVRQIRQASGSKKITDVILFAPPELKADLPSALPSGLKNKVVAVIPGNYHEHHPFELIRLAERKMKPAKFF